jgi:hypothetical protein
MRPLYQLTTPLESFQRDPPLIWQSIKLCKDTRIFARILQILQTILQSDFFANSLRNLQNKLVTGSYSVDFCATSLLRRAYVLMQTVFFVRKKIPFLINDCH